MEKMSGYIELGQTHPQEQGGAVGALHYLPGPLGAGEGGVELQILVVDVQPVGGEHRRIPPGGGEGGKAFSKRDSRGNSQDSRAERKTAVIASRTNSVGGMSSVSA